MLKVINVVENSAAELAGLSRGDRIVAVNGTTVCYGDIEKLYDIMRLTPTEFTTFTVVGEDGVTVDKTMPTGYYSKDICKLYTKGNLYVLDIDIFFDESVEIIVNHIKEVSTKTSSMVIDLRSNRGGSIKAVARVLDAILPEEKLFDVILNGQITEYKSDSECIPDMFFYILIDELIGDVAEVFAAVLQRDNRACVIANKIANVDCIKSEQEYMVGCVDISEVVLQPDIVTDQDLFEYVSKKVKEVI